MWCGKVSLKLGSRVDGPLGRETKELQERQKKGRVSRA